MRLRLPPVVVNVARSLDELAGRALEKLDLRDLHIYGGLTLVGIGLAPLFGLYTLAVVGVVLFYLGVWRME